MIGLKPADLVRVGTLKKEVMKAMLKTQVEVDDQRLKRQTTDLLPEILKRLEQEKERLKLHNGGVGGGVGAGAGGGVGAGEGEGGGT